MSGYSPTAWVDGSAPALSAANLNKLEQGLTNSLGYDTAADLRAAGMPTAVQTAWTRGALVCGDGGHGTWRWDAASTAADNLGTVLLPTGHVGAGRWVRLGAEQGCFVEAFGGDIQAAIDACDVVHFTPGATYTLTAALVLDKPTRLLCAGRRANMARLRCHLLTGYAITLDVPWPAPTFLEGLHLEGLLLDGRDDAGAASDTWAGLFYNPEETTQSHYCTYVSLRHVRVGWSDVADAKAISLAAMFWADLYDCEINNFGYGYGIYAGVANTTTTTVTIRKSYIHYCRQCFNFGGNVNDVTFDSCVFESSVVAGSSFAAALKLNNCFFENIGFDVTGTGITTGLLNKDLGINYSNPDLRTPIISVLNFGIGQQVLDGCTLTNRNAAHITAEPTAGWLMRHGVYSAYGAGGGTTFRNCHFQPSSFTLAPFFENVASANQNAHPVEFVCTNTNFLMEPDDIEHVTSGRLPISSGTDYRAMCEVVHGQVDITDSALSFQQIADLDVPVRAVRNLAASRASGLFTDVQMQAGPQTVLTLDPLIGGTDRLIGGVVRIYSNNNNAATTAFGTWTIVYSTGGWALALTSQVASGTNQEIAKAIPTMSGNELQLRNAAAIPSGVWYGMRYLVEIEWFRGY